MSQKGSDSNSAYSIGIVVAAHNAEKTIAATIDSVIQQTNQSWSLVIVNDGSTDNTMQTVEGYLSDSRITVVSQPNQGAASARNLGVAYLNTTWITYLDADDQLMPVYIESMFSLIKRFPGFDFYACNTEISANNGAGSTKLNITAPTEILFEDMVYECAFVPGGCIQRKEFFVRSGCFDVGLRFAEDYCYFLKAMAAGAKAIVNPEPLYRYTLASGLNKSTNLQGFVNVFRTLESIAAEKNLEKNVVAAIKCAIEVRTETAKQLAIHKGSVPHQIAEAHILSESDMRYVVETIAYIAEEEEKIRQEAILHNTNVSLAYDSALIENRLRDLLGAKGAQAALRVFHGFSWIVRPAREFFTKRRASL